MRSKGRNDLRSYKGLLEPSSNHNEIKIIWNDLRSHIHSWHSSLSFPKNNTVLKISQQPFLIVHNRHLRM